MSLNWLKLFLIHWLYFPAPPVCLSWVHIEGGPQKSCTVHINCYWLFLCEKFTEELTDFTFGISDVNFLLFPSTSAIKIFPVNYFRLLFFLFVFLSLLIKWLLWVLYVMYWQSCFPSQWRAFISEQVNPLSTRNSTYIIVDFIIVI